MNLKSFIPLLLAALCLLYPLYEFKEAYNLSREGLMEDALLTAYEPEVFGGGAGRRYVEDWYVISYSSTTGRYLSGTRSVAVGEGFDRMIASPPLNIGVRVPVLYLPSNPTVMRIKPVSRSPFYLYNSHGDAAMLYLMKLLAFILLLFAIHAFKKSKRAQAGNR